MAGDRCHKSRHMEMLHALSPIFLSAHYINSCHTGYHWQSNFYVSLSFNCISPGHRSGIFSAVFLRRTRLASIDISLRALISALNKDKHINAKLLSARPTQKLDAPLGITLSTIGIAIIIIPALLFGLLQDFSNPHISTTAALANQLLTPFGLFLLLRARRYRQVNADSLLAVDNRKPILFLRSFADDERQKSPWNPDTKRAIFDFSLEIRLAKHFMYFGPFIAVASPTEALPLGGAARVKVSDSEWQARVITWIRDSSLIIMYCGKTNWVKWELGKVLEEGRMHNLILIMPETRGFTRRRRQQDAAARVESIRDVLGDTAWADSISLIGDFPSVLAMVFHSDGSMTVVRTRGGVNRVSANLATLVAHYVVLNDSDIVPPSPSLANDSRALKRGLLNQNFQHFSDLTGTSPKTSFR